MQAPQPASRKVMSLFKLAALVTLAAGLSGCMTIQRWAAEPNPTRPFLYVQNGQVLVNQEPTFVRVDRNGGKAEVVFELPSGLTFVGEGVRVEGLIEGLADAAGRTLSQRDPKPESFVTRLNKRQTVVACTRQSDVRVVCSFNGAKPGQRFIYSVRLAQDGRELPVLDPSWEIM